MATPKRLYKAGEKKKYSEGRISEHRTAWLETFISQFSIMEYDDNPEGEDNSKREVGTTVRLMVPRYGKPLFYNITALTMEELVLLREFFNLLFDKAEPVVKRRDRMAQDAFANGDDSFTRQYRTVPRLVVRQRPSRDDGEVVHQRPDDVPPGDRPDADSPGELRRGGDEVAEVQSGQASAEDDREATD